MPSLPACYGQLARLLEARSPLPASLAELARSLPDLKLKPVLAQLATATTAGEPLATAMAAHPRTFPALHVRLVAVGERGGVLPEVLQMLARLTTTEQQFIRQVRATVLYPALVLLASLGVLGVACTIILPQLVTIFHEMTGREPIPTFAQPLVWVAAVLQVGWPVGVVLLVGATLLGAWLLGGSARAERALLLLCSRLPGGGAVVRAGDYALACELMSVLVRQRLPLAEAFTLVAEGVVGTRLRRALGEWAAAVHAGRPVVEVLAAAGPTAGLLSLAFRLQPAALLADALADLRQVYEEQAGAASDTLLSRIGLAGLAVLLVGVGGVIVAVMAVLIRWVDGMGSCDC